ncbi:MAG TPA: RagB/SusD family nutrient uptake outer membrane protein [Chryseolinea sp.]|nr:RagB/SusD family nutrient uptake outer membrane protein [Chryseolinea sp.]
MKKLIYVFTLCSFLVMSCSKDFLKVTPQSSVTSGDFYKTEDQFNQALIGSYAATRAVKWSVSAWVMGEMRSDNTHFEWGIQRGEEVDERENIDYFMDDQTSAWAAEKYNNCYIGIAFTNNILDNIDAADFSQASKDQIVGEAKFLRALFYFELVRFYGGVPLYTTAVKSTEEAFITRSSTDDTYAFILQDLTDAIAKLSVVSGFPQSGRATQGAARMMLADVYLTRKEWGLAEEQLKAIVQMSYSLLPDYASVYDLENKNSSESVFEIQYQQGDKGQQNSIVYDFLPVSGDVSLITGTVPSRTILTIAQMNMPTREMIGTYEDGDKRLEASIWIAEGSGPQGNMIIESVHSPIGYAWPADKRSYAYIKKFLHAHTLEKNLDDNFPVYRYSETLLALAEALNEQGKSGEALPFLNQVRVRAGLDPSTETDQAILRDIISHERRVELAFENKRWLDLVRTDKVIDVMVPNGAYLKTIFPIIPPAAYTGISHDRYIFPIPLREIVIGKLEQNPGY